MRLITRSDFDGLACAVLLTEAGIVDDYQFAHPKDVQDGLIEVTGDDVLANVPFVPGCGLWFDHHSSEHERLQMMHELDFEGEARSAPSCARVIYDHYGGSKIFSKLDETGLIDAVDKSDTADFTVEDVVNPAGWVLLSFIMDARTGLGRYKDYRVSNYRLMLHMIDYCRVMTADKILQIPDVEERVRRYTSHREPYREMLLANTVVHDNVIVTDLRDIEEMYCGNRFMVYVLFPKQNISLRIMWGRKRQNIVFTCGHSIFNRTSNTDVGSLMLKYGGGGHGTVGTCQSPIWDAERVQGELIEKMKADG